MKKKVVALVLLWCMCFSFTACSHGFGNSSTKDLMESRNKNVIYCFADTVISDKDYDDANVNETLMDFSVRLFQKNIESEQGSANILISPTSVITALSMTSFGAKDETLVQMENVFGLSRGHLNYFNNLYLDNISNELKIANSIWFTNDGRITVKDEFLQFNEEFYGADIYETAFNPVTVRCINDWVQRNTDGAIKDILDEIPADAVMYLINALVFEAEWEEKYDETQIRKGEFTTFEGQKQKVDMMNSCENIYLQDENATGFIKYYKDRNYAFVALIPNNDMDINSYAKTLSGEHLQNVLANSVKASVDVLIPQFSYEYDVEMSDILKEMGMTDAFDGAKADFTNMVTSMNGNVFIDRVLHKTFIEVGPVGTKAGAATVVEMQLDSAQGYDKQVYLNRPFIYMIIDCENNQPVFMGAVNSIE